MFSRLVKSKHQQAIFNLFTPSNVWLQVTRRVGDVTGLDMATAEDLQVVNYGIGGHYEPHFDYARVYKRSFSF
jgi:prolyl 4-hydroxylase